MHSNINETLKIYGDIPKFWNGINGYHYKSEQDLYDDGWRSVITPEIAESEKLGGLYFDENEDVVTYEIIEKTEEEIQSEIISNATANQEVAIESLLKSKLIQELQAVDDDEEILENVDAYPIWKPTGELLKLGTKIRHFNNENELVIYRVNQDILATEQFMPRLAVYAFDEIKMGGDYPIWQQPQAHNPYMNGDIVWYPEEGTTLYISMIDDNFHAPGVVQGNWEIYTL